MGKEWVKLYVELLDDKKVRQLPDRTQLLWIRLMCLAGAHDNGDCSGRLQWEQGDPLSEDEIAEFISATPEELADLRVIFTRRRMVVVDEDGTWVLTNYHKRQDSPEAQRKREQRERERKARNPVTVTGQSQDNRRKVTTEAEAEAEERRIPPTPPYEAAPASPSAAPSLPPVVEEAITQAVRIVREKPRWARQVHETHSDIAIQIRGLIADGKRVTPGAIIQAATAFRDEANKAQAHVLQLFIRQVVDDENAAPATATGPSSGPAGPHDWANLPPARSRGAGLGKLRGEAPSATACQ